MKHASISKKEAAEADSLRAPETSPRGMSIEAPTFGGGVVDRLVQRQREEQQTDAPTIDRGSISVTPPLSGIDFVDGLVQRHSEEQRTIAPPTSSRDRISLMPPRSGIDFVDRDGGAQLQRMGNSRSPSPHVHDALPVQRVAGERVQGRDARRIREAARAGFQGRSGRLPYLSRIQKSFGAHDISSVRSFAGARAAAASRSIQAKAYASGDKIAFSSSTPSLHTVAHEAAHVVQQRAGVRLPGGVGRVGDRHERHADAVADTVIQGKSAERSLDAYFPGTGGAARGGKTGVQRSFDGDLAKDVNTEKNAKKKTDLRYADILLELTDRVETDKHLSLNPDALIAAMIYRLENHDEVTYETYGHLINALKARGAILIDGKESGVREPKKSTKIVINLLLPGSGDRRWRTFSENMIDSGIPTRKNMFEKMEEIPKKDPRRKELGVKSGKTKYPTLFEYGGDTSAGVTYMIRGPGTTDSTTSHPSNSIANNIKTATAIVKSYLKEWPEKQIEVRIMGHSRNAVTAAHLTQSFKTNYPGLEIEAVIFDPVPGGDANMFGSHNEETLSEKDDVNSTVVYSLMDARPGFNPMKVYGAKRLILTHYSHHAGIEAGFTFDKKHYKGLGLIDLPAGLFIDSRVSPGMPNRLIGPVNDWDTIKIVWTAAKMEKNKKNEHRLARIRKVVEAFLGTKVDDKF